MEGSQGSQEQPVKKIRHDLDITDDQNLRSRELQNFVRLQSQTNRNDKQKFEDGNQAINLTVLNEAEVKSEVIQGSESETATGNRSVDAYPGSIITCTGYNPRVPNQDNALLFPTKPYPHLFSPPIVQASYIGEARYSAMQQSASYTAYPQSSQPYGLPPFDALWPGVKTEDGSHSHPGYLSYSTGFSSDQTSPAYYTYPVQGAGFPRTSIYSGGAVVANVATPSSSNQEYHSYTSLGQSQYVPYFPSSNYASTVTSNPQPASSTTVTYQLQKTEAEVSNSKDETFQSGVSVAGQTLSTTVIKELKEQSQKHPSGKSRGKGKKSCSSPPPDNKLERVFVWDLDETIIIFHSLLTGSYAQRFGKDAASALTLGLRMEEMIFDLADTHLFFNDLEECDQVHVEDVAADDNGQDLTNYDFAADGFHGSVPGSSHSSGGIGQGGVDWMRKLAFRYRQVKKIYNTYSTNVGELLNPAKRDSLQQLKADVEVLTDSWLATALKSLMLIQSRRNCINILVTTTQLVPALAKVLLYGLGEIFPIENIYSATKIGKESCFERIVSRFGKRVTYVVIGDGRDEEYAAKQHNMPFWRILNHGDLMSLHQALELDYL
ncbi:eyes absent homolog 3-like isoform X1 [Pristis pectinata]|uniref:eyes absent homolog 3-like isoform X1 n=1 Tax=Pristis pectinata TaxID=685728 RepID=UPI00223D74A4|nr:eyes absent homolog 3-like isoform X1 [Pristis pectinata]XP_051892000.1 eyes absent homolog 3-like isoform X1 [Pristis pectinata]